MPKYMIGGRQVELNPMWLCVKCGIAFGDLSEHPQAPNQCPDCMNNTQGKEFVAGELLRRAAERAKVQADELAERVKEMDAATEKELGLVGEDPEKEIN